MPAVSEHPRIALLGGKTFHKEAERMVAAEVLIFIVFIGVLRWFVP